ncbi:MAG TPA: DUF3710 domain-containing protein [Propionibacteriaceae bacterium]
MIFRRDKKRRDEAEAAAAEVETSDEQADVAPAEDDTDVDGESALDVDALDDIEWRETGPWDVSEVDDLENNEEGPRIDLGAMILTGVPGSELRLQVAEDTQQIVSAMLIIETTVPAETEGNGARQSVTSALELGAYAAPRSGGFWPELREEISESATESGGSASLNEGPFGVELFRLIPVTTPDGEEGYQPSKMWVAEGPRWLLRGIVYGQAAIEDNDDSDAVAAVVSAFRKVVVRRGDDAMAPGDLLPLSMPTNLVSEEPS